MKNRIAKHLLDIKAVFLNPDDPFTWASGIRAPIYCDNRLTLSYPYVRRDIESSLATLIKTSFDSCDMIMGTATAGIAHAALVAELLDLPMGYVRSDAKKHGRTNQIEGKIEPGMRIVVIEDLISTGGSSIACIKALQAAGCIVVGLAAIFSYGLEKSFTAFNEINVPFVTLTDYDTLIDVAIDHQYIDVNAKNKLLEWKKDPSDTKWMTY